jgi:glycosyltransferase involved in cell wall biosynthesis
MHILKLSQTYYPHLEMGGPPVKVKAIAERLAQRGHSVMVLTANYGNPRCTEIRQVGGVEVVYLGYIARYRTLTVNPDILGFCWRQLQAFNVIHIYGLYDLLGPIVAFWARHFGIPYVIEPLGMVIPKIRSLRKKQLYHLVLGRWLLRNASLIIVTSEAERRELLHHGFTPSSLALRRNGIDLSEFENLPPKGLFRKRWNIPNDVPVVLFLGRICSKKSPDLLIRSVAKLGRDDVWLVIAGPEEDRGYVASMRSLAIQLKLGERTIFPGPLYGEEKVAALTAADIFALPSQWENFGNVVAEAIAAGTPAIISNQCGIAPYIENKVGLVVPLSVEDFRKAISVLLNNDSLYQHFIKNCPALARSFSWEEPIVQMEQYYLRLVNQPKGDEQL